MRIYSSPTNFHRQSTNIDGQQNIEKVPQNSVISSDFQPVKILSGENSSKTQLSQLLSRFDALQRLFTTLSLVSSLPGHSPSLITQLLPQLFIPQHQTRLINWLKHGAGNQALGEILAQLAIPQSTLNQWLDKLPDNHQDDLKALLRLAAEQRAMEPTKGGDDTAIQLHFPQLNGREIQLEIRHQPAKPQNKEKVSPRQWTVNLTLPVGLSDSFYATAIGCDNQLNLVFESENAAVIQRVEHLSPLLFERLATMGIKTNTVNFRMRSAASTPLSAQGLSIKV